MQKNTEARVKTFAKALPPTILILCDVNQAAIRPVRITAVRRIVTTATSS
jgi:hypothetical protein